MFFKKKHIVECIICCTNKEMQYSVDENGHNVSICQYSFEILEPDSMKNKILYEYNDATTLYEIGHMYKAKFNIRDGSFEVKL